MSDCIGPINIIPDNNQVVLLDNNRSITVIDNNCCTNVDVTQPITSVVQISTGPIGPVGPSGSSGSQGSTGPSGSSAPFTYVSGTIWNTTSSIEITGSLIVSGSNTFRNIGPAQFTGSVGVLGALTAPNITGSLYGTASWAENAISSSYTLSSSYAQTASYLSGYVSPFPFTGSAIISGSLIITGSLITNNGVNVQTITASFISASSGITGSLFGTSSWANNAITASYVQNAQTASYVLNAISSSYATTSSFAQSGNGPCSGSFSGSGANLNSIPASAIVGLNLSQIATGSVTASVTPTQFSVVSGSSTELVVTGTGVTIGNIITDIHRVTGSLNISGSITGSLFGTASYALTASYIDGGFY